MNSIQWSEMEIHCYIYACTRLVTATKFVGICQKFIPPLHTWPTLIEQFQWWRSKRSTHVVGFFCHWRFSEEGTRDSRAEYNSSSGRWFVSKMHNEQLQQGKARVKSHSLVHWFSIISFFTATLFFNCFELFHFVRVTLFFLLRKQY